MNAAWLVVLLIFAVWLVALITLTIADELAKRRHDVTLNVRDWQDKVNAMRRLQDEEGSA